MQPPAPRFTPGLRHWLLQILPPLLMLSVLFAATQGPSLVYLAGLFVIPVLISAISILAKLIFFGKRKYFLVRPALTIAIFVLLLVIADLSYDRALAQTVESARAIHRHCNDQGVCPRRPGGWLVEGSRIRRNDLGDWLSYPASYHYDEAGFEIRVYRGPDIGDVIRGGVGRAFEVTPYVEN